MCRLATKYFRTQAAVSASNKRFRFAKTCMGPATVFLGNAVVSQSNLCLGNKWCGCAIRCGALAMAGERNQSYVYQIIAMDLKKTVWVVTPVGMVKQRYACAIGCELAWNDMLHERGIVRTKLRRA